MNNGARLRALIAACGVGLTVLAATREANAQAGTTGTGQVQLPLETLSQWVESTQPGARAREAAYALGTATVEVTLEAGSSEDPSFAREAGVKLRMTVESFDERRKVVPLLPLGTNVRAARVAGKPIALTVSEAGIGWSNDRPGSHEIEIDYSVVPLRSETGWSLALPLLRAPGVDLRCRFPGRVTDVAVFPATSFVLEAEGAWTVVRARLPTTEGVQIAWRRPGGKDHVVSQATYTGTVGGSAVSWAAELVVELLGSEEVVAPLLPVGVTLHALSVDDKPATILVRDDHFAALIRGRGRHVVKAGFEVPVRAARARRGSRCRSSRFRFRGSSSRCRGARPCGSRPPPA